MMRVAGTAIAVIVAALASLVAAQIRADTLEDRLQQQAAPPLADRLETLEAKYRCRITAYLSAIHRKPMTPRGRYLILATRVQPEFYLQCMFFDADRQMHCEGTSGFYHGAIAGFATSAKLATLTALGFSTDAAAGNFVHERAIPDHEALYDVAGMLIEALVRVYDMQIEDVLDFKAPLVPRPPPLGIEGSRNCPALIGLR